MPSTDRPEKGLDHLLPIIESALKKGANPHALGHIIQSAGECAETGARKGLFVSINGPMMWKGEGVMVPIHK